MRYENCQFNLRPRSRFFIATAGLSLALWLLLTVAEAYSPLHAWLHGGAIPDNDDCAIVMLAHGKIETTVSSAPEIVPVVWTEIIQPVQNFVAASSENLLPAGRAPPVLPVVS